MSLKNIILPLSILYILFITTLLLVNFSENNEIPKIPHLDKLVHLVIYFGMNFLLLFLFKTFLNKKRSIATLTPTIFTIFYSILIELIQPYVGRSFDLLDIAANSIGSIGAIPIFFWVDKVIQRAKTTSHS